MKVVKIDRFYAEKKGFCEFGIKQFCKDNEIDFYGSYTRRELRNIVLRKRRLNCEKYYKELKKIGVSLHVDAKSGYIPFDRDEIIFALEQYDWDNDYELDNIDTEKLYNCLSEVAAEIGYTAEDLILLSVYRVS